MWLLHGLLFLFRRRISETAPSLEDNMDHLSDYASSEEGEAIVAERVDEITPEGIHLTVRKLPSPFHCRS